MKMRLVILALALAWAGPALRPPSAPALTAEQKAWLTRAERHEKAGWTYLHIEGGPRERGFQHGFLLAREIAENIRVQRRIWEYQSAMKWSWLVDKAAVLFKGKIDPENAAAYLEAHPQYDWMSGLIKDRPTQPWTVFKAGEGKEP